MKFTRLEIPDVILVEPDVFGDARGFFTETYHLAKYAEGGITAPFVQDNFSFSRRGILRGLHYQRRQPQGKLVWVARGEILDVAVDIRRSSATFGKWVSRTLTGGNRAQMYVPPGFAHGFLVLSEEAEVMYKCTELYDASDDRGVAWNDPQLAIPWPDANPQVSGKDARLPFLANIPPADMFT